jgi:hypothetical protein
MRDRRWVEVSTLRNPLSREQIDINDIVGEPEDRRVRHTPPLDRSGELWLPGPSGHGAK